MATSILNLPELEYMLPGNRACAGCSVGIIYRHLSKALDGKAIFVVPASCFTVLCGMYPTASVTVPVMNSVFPGTAACASGIAASLKKQGKEDVTVVAMAGDGGTADIGIQGLSGAAERNANILFVCYDNEAYMNTGTQRSGATPLGAKTSTTTSGKHQFAKDLSAIIEAHHVPYMATGSPGYPGDLYDKVRKARFVDGTRFLHLNAPCPSGWQYAPCDTVAIAKAAIECAAFILFEIDHGHYRLTGPSLALAQKDNRKPIRDYVLGQGRFKGFDETTFAAVQEYVDAQWNRAVARHIADNGAL